MSRFTKHTFELKPNIHSLKATLKVAAYYKILTDQHIDIYGPLGTQILSEKGLHLNNLPKISHNSDITECCIKTFKDASF